MIDEIDESVLALIAQRIVERYNTPGRSAYTYLFRLHPQADFSHMLPNAAEVIAAWVDEGQRLTLAPASQAIQQAQHTRAVSTQTTHSAAHTLIRPERRQMMARAILFSCLGQTNREVYVHLFSRALAFSPKGDREAFEFWRRDSTGDWYSSRREDD